MTLKELFFTPRASEFWDVIHAPAYDSYWSARRDGFNENDSIKRAIDALKRKLVELESAIEHDGE